jgi:hypothetical protein
VDEQAQPEELALVGLDRKGGACSVPPALLVLGQPLGGEAGPRLRRRTGVEANALVLGEQGDLRLVSGCQRHEPDRIVLEGWR